MLLISLPVINIPNKCEIYMKYMLKYLNESDNMEKKKKNKIKLKIIAGSLISVLTLNTIRLINNEANITSLPIKYYQTYEDDYKYATYKNGDVYIIDSRKDLGNISYNDNDIIIIDYRENEDMIIMDSYKIDDVNIRNQIIDIRFHYTEKYPTDMKWQRTRDSLLNEWYVHNILYDLHLYRDHTEDVDFENNEEEDYSLFFFKRKIK